MSGIIRKAGGIVILEKESKKYILLTKNKKYDDWAFPKGHIEMNEIPLETSIREIKEETGIDNISLIKELPMINYDIEGNKVILYMFMFKSDKEEIINEDGHESKWIDSVDVKDTLTYENQKNYYDKLSI